MPSFKAKIFDQLEVEVHLTEEGEIDAVTTDVGVELDFTGILFPIYKTYPDGKVVHTFGDLDDYFRTRIGDCMNDWFYEIKEHHKARGRDRFGEE